MDSVLVFLSNLVLFLSLTTLIFAVGACLALMLRRRQPASTRRQDSAPGEVALLRRYVPHDDQ